MTNSTLNHIAEIEQADWLSNRNDNGKFGVGVTERHWLADDWQREDTELISDLFWEPQYGWLFS